MGKTYSFVDTTALGARVIALLKACLFTKFGMVFMNIDRIVAVRRAGEDVVNVAEMETTLSAILGTVDSVLWLMAHIYFFIWLYRSAANARAMGRAGFSQSPCWSFVNFLIPVGRLVKPFLFMREVLLASTQGAADASGDPTVWRRGRMPGDSGMKLLAWAGVFLVTALASCASAAALFMGMLSLLKSGMQPQDALGMEMLPSWTLAAVSASGAVASVSQALQAFLAGGYVGMVTSAQKMSRVGAVAAAPAAPEAGEAAASEEGFGWPDEPVR